MKKIVFVLSVATGVWLAVWLLNKVKPPSIYWEGYICDRRTGIVRPLGQGVR